MQISSRFTEYGLTGGFFWICQLILIWSYGKTQTILSSLPTVHLGPDQLGSTAITSLVTAVAIIAVFVTGLLLDLLAVYFRRLEMGVFWKHMVRNRDWLSRLITEHKSIVKATTKTSNGGATPFRRRRNDAGPLLG